MALTVSEEWIRQRVQLKHSNLEDVKSLSLPGTYHEKIGTLDTALRHFSRLKHLDLSRNAIGSLQGLENLKLLEKLNLYYNNVSGLEELYHLRHNSKLHELDLRLNPVARNEPDYRLFLIHMLPNLRRLDDRSVRDSERKAALMHFSSDQANELTVHAQKPVTTLRERPPNPRVEHVKTLPKSSGAIDMEDEENIDLIQRTKGDLGQPRKVTGSIATEPAVEDYPPEVVRKMDKAAAGQVHNMPLTEPLDAQPVGASLPYMNGTISTEETQTQNLLPLTEAQVAMQARYPNIPMAATRTDPTCTKAAGIDPTQLILNEESKKNRVHFAADNNLRFQDEMEAYTSYKAQGNFTPHPGNSRQYAAAGHQLPLSSAAQLSWQSNQASAELYGAPSQTQSHMVSKPLISSIQPNLYDHNSTASYEECPANKSKDRHEKNDPDVLVKLSNIVDKYWNGSQSLLANSKFKDQAISIIQEYVGRPEVDTMMGRNSTAGNTLQLEDELQHAHAENTRLRELLSSGSNSLPPSFGPEDSKTKTLLIRAQRDTSILRSRLQASLEENRTLQGRIADLESSACQPRFDDSANSQREAMEEEISHLRQEVVMLNTRLKQAAQLQELASMLQESHKALVQTNEHLLAELDQTKQRHHSEVKQLHWSYDQLKKTMDHLPTDVAVIGAS